jgi:hypothetical protein
MKQNQTLPKAVISKFTIEVKNMYNTTMGNFLKQLSVKIADSNIPSAITADYLILFHLFLMLLNLQKIHMSSEK